jgi:hypothetical protein
MILGLMPSNVPILSLITKLLEIAQPEHRAALQVQRDRAKFDARLPEKYLQDQVAS